MTSNECHKLLGAFKNHTGRKGSCLQILSSLFYEREELVLKNRWHLWQREIILPQITAVHCIVLLVVLSHQWCFIWFFLLFFFLMHFHKAVLRRTLCAGSWMYFKKETPLQRTLSLNCKDGWSKNEGWLFCFLQMGAEAGEVTIVAKVTLGVHGIASWSLKCSSSILSYIVSLFPCCWIWIWYAHV